jgi:surface antigen
MRLAICAVTGALLCACSPTAGPNETSYTLAGCATGALGGGLMGNLLGHGNAGATLAGVGLGAAAGCLTGNAIGRQLDEQDRRIAAAATLRALSLPPGRQTTWQSDHSTNNGRITVQSAQKVASNGSASSSGGGECKTVREVAYIKGQEVTQDAKYCRNPQGEWASA